MKPFIYFSALALICTSLQADILLDQVMSQDEQKKTGVANLSAKQKIALEMWLNQNFVPKQKEQPANQAPLSLSINVNNGQKLILSDNSVWEVAPSDTATASVWITPIPVKITPSNDATYPSLITNTNDNTSIKARRVPS